MTRKILLAAAVLLVAIQLYPVERAAPADRGLVDAPPAARAILERACFDCHSNRTRWPWYSHVAPVSWLVADDVKEGREHVNFTRWADYDGGERRHILHELVEEVEHGKMPLPVYLTMHADARVTAPDLEQLRAWAAAAGVGAGDAGHEGHEDHEDDD